MEFYVLFLLTIYSPQYGIDPKLAAAIVKTESSFNPSAKGQLGEIGLFQVRPEFSKYPVHKLYNPEYNIAEGLRILSKAKEQCKHQVDKQFVVCYNLGITGGSKIKYPSKFRYYKKVYAYYKGYSNGI